ncbi:MAG: TIGR03118 family protein [Actinobacteria bacterium]|nr:MAG: TIGR03118 family protein [Actinomycetota bacterium]
MERALTRRLATLVAALGAATLIAGLPAVATAASTNVYTVTNLVSDVSGVAPNTDSNLVNAWGLTSTPGSPWWVADNATSVSTVYAPDGTTFRPPVQVQSAPTGAVSNTGSSFVVSNGTNTGPATFLFATEDGTILGWRSGFSPGPAVVAVTTPGAKYKGLAIAGSTLYATDFHNGRVDVFNGSFQPVNITGAFVDPGIPAGYAPFGIQNVAGEIVVTYAKQDADQEDDVAGQGHGFVDRFSTSGTFLGRVATHGQLNSPWGIAMAPPDFGRFSNDLLIGNFGDGQISAFERQLDGTFELVGQLRTSDHTVLTIDGLWALQFGKGAMNNGPTTTLFFTAGPEHESHGLFGTITAG